MSKDSKEVNVCLLDAGYQVKNGCFTHPVCFTHNIVIALAQAHLPKSFVEQQVMVNMLIQLTKSKGYILRIKESLITKMKAFNTIENKIYELFGRNDRMCGL